MIAFYIFCFLMVVAVWLLAVGYLAGKAIDYSSFLLWLLTVIVFCFGLTIGILGLIYVKNIENAKGPCVHEETSLYWNPATKTMMPARVCVERGEWVK